MSHLGKGCSIGRRTTVLVTTSFGTIVWIRLLGLIYVMQYISIPTKNTFQMLIEACIQIRTPSVTLFITTKTFQTNATLY